MATFILDARSVQDHFPGIGRYSFRLACALADYFTQDTFRLLYDARVTNTRFDLRALWARPNVERIAVSAKFFSLAEQRLVFDARLTARGDAFHSPYYALPLALSIPKLVTLADLTPLVLPEEMPSPLRRAVYRFLNQAAARRAQAVLTFSDASRADLERILKISRAKISIVPLAADESFAPQSLSEIARVRHALALPEKYALYVGSNKPHKNLRRLVEAWNQVESDAVLVIAGAWDGRYPEAQELTTKFNLQERVLFYHNIAENNLPALFGGATCFVFPSVHEGFGLPPLEAMACGVPVICANASSLPEVVGDAALLFNPFQIQDLTRALSELLNNANLRAELRTRGIIRARQFSWERVARETMQVYQSVCG